MGKGDRKSRRGKITKGTYGVLRPRKKSKLSSTAKAEKPKSKAKPKPKAKPKAKAEAKAKEKPVEEKAPDTSAEDKKEKK